MEVREMRHSFFLVDHEFMDDWVMVLGPKVSMVYILLCRMASKDQFCFPSTLYIAKRTKMRTTAVTKALFTLERYKIITIERRMGRQSIYWLNSKTNWKKQKEGEIARPDFLQ